MDFIKTEVELGTFKKHAQVYVAQGTVRTTEAAVKILGGILINTALTTRTAEKEE